MYLKLTQNNASALWSPNCVFQIVSYQLSYIYKGPQNHRGVCLDNLEAFIISFKTFEKIPRISV